jgi:SAM-dependent methyltransferase
MFRSPRETDEEIVKSYQKMEDPDYLREQECRSINAQLCLRALRRFKAGGRLLEIGSSLGFFLNAARLDFDVVGLEPSRWAARLARERMGLDVREDLPSPGLFPENSFDAVCLLDVLEHLADPRGVLALCARWLRPGGVLYLVTPDTDSLSARTLGAYWWGLRSAHLTYFSRRLLRELLSSLNLELVHQRSYGRLFTYGYWLTRLAHYPRWGRALAGGLVRLFGVENKVVYIDTRDSVEICAVKRGEI